MTKKFISAVLAVAVVVGALCGCSNSEPNPFIADDAIKGQIGDLYYVVPSNAVLDDSSDDSNIIYTIPIENSTEEYTLNISLYKETGDKEESIKNFEKSIQFNKDVIFNGDDVNYITEDIYEFAETAIDKGVKITIERDDKKDIGVMVIKFPKAYSISYSAKTGFFDQSIWDNFYEQLKYVGLDSEN